MLTDNPRKVKIIQDEDAFFAGVDAYNDGRPQTDCPHGDRNGLLARSWLAGWADANVIAALRYIQKLEKS